MNTQVEKIFEREANINAMICPECGYALHGEDRSKLMTRKLPFWRRFFLLEKVYAIYLVCSHCHFEHYHYLQSLHRAAEDLSVSL